MLCTAVIFVDGFNSQVTGYILPALAKNWHLPKSVLGAIPSSSQFGSLLGVILVAPFSARIGYRTMLIAGTCAFGLITLLAAFAQSVEALLVLRFLTGIGLGAVLPNAQVMNGEFFPRRRRSTMVVVGGSGVTLGSLAAGVVSGFVLPSFGWRAVLACGGAAALVVAALLFMLLPEPLDYLVSRRGDQTAARALARRIDPDFPAGDDVVIETAAARRSGSLFDLFRDGRAAGTLAIWCAYMCNLSVYAFLQSWMTLIIVDSGHSQGTAIAATSSLVMGGVLSIFLFGPLMDRYLPYKVLTAATMICAALVALLGSLLSGQVWLIMVSAFVTGFVLLGTQKSLNALAIYFYPAALRPTGVSWGFGAGRSGQTVAPLLAGILLQLAWQPASLFYIAAAPLLLAAAAMIVLWRRYGSLGAGR